MHAKSRRHNSREAIQLRRHPDPDGNGADTASRGKIRGKIYRRTNRAIKNRGATPTQLQASGPNLRSVGYRKRQQTLQQNKEEQ